MRDRRLLKVTFAMLILSCVISDATNVAGREWSDHTGKFRVEAELVAVRNGKVILERKDGSIVSLPLTKLSPADQAFVQSGAANSTTDQRPASEGSNALAEQVHAILKANCYRCHGEEGVNEGGFNYVLDLEKIARTHVQEKSPENSSLFERMSAIDDSVMPPPDEKPRPSAADIATIKAWIEAGSPSLVKEIKREHISNDKVMEYVLADIRNANERSRRFLRYFTLSHLYNAGVSEDELQTYRNAFAKLLNSLSWNPTLVLEQAIDPARTILRVDIRQLNWTQEIWEQIEQANPYFLALNTPDSQACGEFAQTNMPCVRVDWFVFAGSKPPLYHTILAIPNTAKELEQILKVNADANIEQEQVMRAGFNRSGVSQHNRMIERHASAYGSYWKSYDFGGSTGERNLFEFPMGPNQGTDSFRHDGGELIFTLPNGLQGYMLVDAEGNRIDKGPTEIVSDPKRPDRAVTNGVSCMSCHYSGMISKKDEIGPFVKANLKAFDKADDILALYVQADELDKVIDEDAQRFAGAMKKLGIATLSRSGEPVSAMAACFEQELDRNMVACEFGLTPPEFDKRLDTSEAMARSFGALRTPGGTVKRDVFVELFGRASIEFRLTTEVNESAIASSPRQSPPTIGGKNDKVGEVRKFEDLRRGVDSMAFSPNGRYIATGSSRDLEILDVPNGGRIDVQEKLEILSQITSCAFTPDGGRLLTGGRSGHIIIWKVSREGKLEQAGQFAGHSKEVNCIAISADGRLAVSGSDEKKVRCWQIADGKELGNFIGFEGKVKAVQISPDGSSALATDGQNLWRLDLRKNQGKILHKLNRSWASGQAAAFSPDGKLVAAGDTYSIRLWNISSGKELPVLEGNEIQWSAVFTPDGTRLITGGSEKVNVWDVRKQQRIHAFQTSGHGYVQCLAASWDSKFVAATSRSGHDLQIFRLPAAAR